MFSFFSKAWTAVKNFFAGKDKVTPAEVLADARVAVADLSAVVAVVAAIVPTAAYVAPAAAALAVAARVVNTLSNEPAITDLAGVVKAFEDVVNIFPAGPNQKKAAAAIASVQAGFVTLSGGAATA